MFLKPSLTRILHGKSVDRAAAMPQPASRSRHDEPSRVLGTASMCDSFLMVGANTGRQKQETSQGGNSRRQDGARCCWWPNTARSNDCQGAARSTRKISRRACRVITAAMLMNRARIVFGSHPHHRCPCP